MSFTYELRDVSEDSLRQTETHCLDGDVGALVKGIATGCAVPEQVDTQGVRKGLCLLTMWTIACGQSQFLCQNYSSFGSYQPAVSYNSSSESYRETRPPRLIQPPSDSFHLESSKRTSPTRNMLAQLDPFLLPLSAHQVRREYHTSARPPHPPPQNHPDCNTSACPLAAHRPHEGYTSGTCQIRKHTDPP